MWYAFSSYQTETYQDSEINTFHSNDPNFKTASHFLEWPNHISYPYPHVWPFITYSILIRIIFTDLYFSDKSRGAVFSRREKTCTCGECSRATTRNTQRRQSWELSLSLPATQSSIEIWGQVSPGTCTFFPYNVNFQSSFRDFGSARCPQSGHNMQFARSSDIAAWSTS